MLRPSPTQRGAALSTLSGKPLFMALSEKKALSGSHITGEPARRMRPRTSYGNEGNKYRKNSREGGERSWGRIALKGEGGTTRARHRNLIHTSALPACAAPKHRRNVETAPGITFPARLQG